MNFRFIYKIINIDEWQIAKKNGLYTGSPKDIKDGFIHFSGEEQVDGTLKKFFTNQKNLILLKVNTLNLDHLLWEQASDGNMFPHLYSTLEVSNVVGEYKIIQKEDGSHILPSEF